MGEEKVSPSSVEVPVLNAAQVGGSSSSPSMTTTTTTTTATEEDDVDKKMSDCSRSEKDDEENSLKEPKKMDAVDLERDAKLISLRKDVNKKLLDEEAGEETTAEPTVLSGEDVEDERSGSLEVDVVKREHVKVLRSNLKGKRKSKRTDSSASASTNTSKMDEIKKTEELTRAVNKVVLESERRRNSSIIQQQQSSRASSGSRSSSEKGVEMFRDEVVDEDGEDEGIMMTEALRRHHLRQPAGIPPRTSAEKEVKTVLAKSVVTEATATATSSAAATPDVRLSVEDIEICQRLDDEYERALEEREVGYNARYDSVRQSACFSVTFMIIYLVLGILFFTRYAGWELHEAVFFCVYTITTVGYGSDKILADKTFQLFTIGFIFVGIATLTIMVAQIYQCIALEASRAQHERDKHVETSRRGRRNDLILGESAGGRRTRLTSMRMSTSSRTTNSFMTDPSNLLVQAIDWCVVLFDAAKVFFRDSELGRGVSIVFPLGGLILAGAVVVGPLEGWSVVESIYFACVTMTTVGYGVYVPERSASKWFCVFWLPFSVGFMSIFLGNIASFYIRLSDKNIRRLENQMRRRIQAAKDRVEKERLEALQRAYRGQAIQIGGDLVLPVPPQAGDGDDNSIESGGRHPLGLTPSSSTSQRRKKKKKRTGFNALPTEMESGDDESSGAGDDGSKSVGKQVLFGSSGVVVREEGGLRRRRILQNFHLRRSSTTASAESAEGDSSSSGTPGQGGRATIQTMRDVLQAVKAKRWRDLQDETGEFLVRSSEEEFMSLRSREVLPDHTFGFGKRLRKPSFGLRVLVQERFAEIIATEIAGFQSHIEIKENTLSVSIDTLKQTADKWLVPRRARKAFRAMAFEALYFVGEHGLITRGADALYELSPFEFHGLFAPLLAAMGDAATMEGWLTSTDVLAEVDLMGPARVGGDNRASHQSVVRTGHPRSTTQQDTGPRVGSMRKGAKAIDGSIV